MATNRLQVPGADATRGGGGYGPFSTPLLVQRSMTRDVELPRATRVTGVVLTSAGRPAAQAIVEVRGYERTRADAAGRFSFQGLEPGALPLVARLGDEATRSTGLALASGRHEEVILTLTPAARISGTVTWEDGTPAATCPITVVPRAWSDVPRAWSDVTEDLRSGGDGRFSIGGLPPGEVAVVATAPDADPAPPARGTPASAFLALTAGEHRTDVRLVVSRGAGVKDARPGLPPAAPGGAPAPATESSPPLSKPICSWGDGDPSSGGVTRRPSGLGVAAPAGAHKSQISRKGGHHDSNHGYTARQRAGN